MLGHENLSITIIENNIPNGVLDSKVTGYEIFFAIPSFFHGMAPNDIHQPKASGLFAEVKDPIGQ
jgi:hypothetical protein